MNKGGLVEIVVTDAPKRIDEFIRAIERDKPAPAEIVHIKREKLITREFTDFTILCSDEGGLEAAMIPADLAVCPECLREMYDKDNRRYMHPFISCMPAAAGSIALQEENKEMTSSRRISEVQERDEKEESYFDKMAQSLESEDIIDQDLYSKFNVKRGLRNANGTGVLVGLTRIGNVHDAENRQMSLSKRR